MKHELLKHEELRKAMDEAQRGNKPLSKVPMNRWTALSLWVLRLYILVTLGLIGFKFVQMAGFVG